MLNLHSTVERYLWIFKKSARKKGRGGANIGAEFFQTAQVCSTCSKFFLFKFQRAVNISSPCTRIFFNGSAKITAGNTGNKNCEVCRFTRIGGFANSSAFLTLDRPPGRGTPVQKRNRAENIGELSDIGEVTDVFENFIPLLHSTISPGALAARTCPFHRRCFQVSPSFDAAENARNKLKTVQISQSGKMEKLTFSTCLSKILLVQIVRF